MTKKYIKKLVHNFAEYMYKTGYEDGISKHIEKVNEATYETGVARGREQAWECARKIRGLYQGELCGVFPYDEENDRGDYDDFCTDWLYDYSASEAIQKIKEWEEKQQAEKSCKTCRYDYEICTPKYIDLRCWQSKQTDDEVKEQEETDNLSSTNKHKCLSVEAIERVFRYRHPDLAINDIRPLAGDFFKEDYPYGITIWLKNGDMIEYYPALPVDAEERKHLK